MSDDAHASRHNPLSVCYLCDMDRHAFTHPNTYDIPALSGMDAKTVEVWKYVLTDSMKSSFKDMDMSISSIPSDVEGYHSNLTARMATMQYLRDIYLTDDTVAPKRSIASFGIYVLHLSNPVDHAYIQDIIRLNPDAQFMDCRGVAFTRPELSRLIGIRDLRKLMVRNTHPLIKRAKDLLTHPDERKGGYAGHISAVEIQLLWRQKTVGLKAEDISAFNRSMRILSEEKLIRGDLNIGRYETPNLVITGLGHNLLNSLHPSSRDPGFVDRYLAWFEDPEGHKEQYTRWIRTWSGRLRRHQAKIWKQSVSPSVSAWVSEVLNPLISERTVFSVKSLARDLVKTRPEAGSEELLRTIIISEMGKSDKVRTSALFRLPPDIIMTCMTQDGDRIYGPPEHFRL